MSELISALHTNPLFGVFLTVAAYCFAVSVWRRSGAHPLFHPVLVATGIVALLLVAMEISYEHYFAQAHLLNELLAVVVVLLAVPLSRQLHLILAAGNPLAVALCAGSIAAILSALVLPLLLGAERDLLATLAPKSTTAAVAVEIAGQFGGAEGLSAVVVISTGVFGAVFGPSILRGVGVLDERALGFALGVASHAIGTARAFQISEVAGVFASLGLILNAILTIALVPLALALSESL